MKASAPSLSDEEVRRLLELTREADSVELKLTVPEEEGYAIQTALTSTRSTPRFARSSSSIPPTWTSTPLASSPGPRVQDRATTQ